jgi:hypothetical protein
MPTWKKICLDLAVLVALGVAVNTPGTELVCPTGTAPGIHSPHVSANFPPPTGG